MSLESIIYNPLIIFGGAIVGVVLILIGSKIHHQLEEYEFKNRTDGGVVRFQKYDDEVRHGNKKGLKDILFGIALLLFFPLGALIFRLIIR